MKNNYLEFYNSSFGCGKYCTKSWGLASFEAGAQSQQAEIDAITKQRDSFIKAHHIAMNDVCEHKAKIDELQSRVDEALKILKDWDDQSYRDDMDQLTGEIEDILKGNKDENY